MTHKLNCQQTIQYEILNIYINKCHLPSDGSVKGSCRCDEMCSLSSKHNHAWVLILNKTKTDQNEGRR